MHVYSSLDLVTAPAPVVFPQCREVMQAYNLARDCTRP